MKKLILFVMFSALAANAGVVRVAAKDAGKGAKVSAKAAKKVGKLALKVLF